jgi:hypothetical protein
VSRRKKYTRKPVNDVEACYWDGSNTDGILDLKKHAHRDARFWIAVDVPEDAPFPTGELEVLTIDGNRVVVPIGAYVVLDPKGWPYPCSAEVFKLTFEEQP